MSAFLGVLAACYPALSGPGGASSTAPSPATRWASPASSAREPSDSRLTADQLPPALESRRTQLNPTDLVALALERSPETQVSWLSAQAAAASYGNAGSAVFPDISGSVTINRLKTAATGGRVSVEQTTYGPSLSLSWLLLDFGGRAGAIDAARQGLFAANWTHNAVISDVVRRTLQGYFAYVAARSLVEANRVTLQQAQVNLAAAEDRRTVGVATIAETMQARSAVSQALLVVQQSEGALASTRGALAVLIGLPPTAAFEVDTTEANAVITPVVETVDSVMKAGLLGRPDLAAERAQVDARRAVTRATRAQYLPSLSATGAVSSVWVGSNSQSYPSYNVGLALAIPIFNGFGWQYATRAAALTADAEAARLRNMEQQVALQVYESYQALRTATQSVSTAEELIASATSAADAMRARYREGVGSLLELLSAENVLASARSQRIQSRAEWHTSLVQLAHDAGLLAPSGATSLHPAPASPSNAPGNKP
jgi:outer membrane protein